MLPMFSRVTRVAVAPPYGLELRFADVGKVDGACGSTLALARGIRIAGRT